MNFAKRTELAARLENTFICAFNKHIQSHRILKSGMEATEIRVFHSAIRFCNDATTHFVRYHPDAVLISLDPSKEDTALIEFKCADTGVRKDSFLQRLNRQCPQMDPPFGTRHDIYNIEADALDHYKRLVQIGVKVIVVAYRSWHLEMPLRAQFAQDIAVCNVYDPNRGRQNIGSGTLIANANFASLVRVTDFFATHFELNLDALTSIERLVLNEFNRGS